MSEDFKREKQIFMTLYGSDMGEYISNSEYNKLSWDEKKRCDFDRNGRRHMKKPLELLDDELDMYIKMKEIDYLNKIDSKIDTIKSILVFWCTLTIIGLVLSIISYR